MLTWLSSAWGSDSGAVVPVQPVLCWCLRCLAAGGACLGAAQSVLGQGWAW